MQNDTGNRYSPTVIAAAITSQTNKAKLPTHIALSAPDYGLPRDSVVLLEQIRTLDKRRLRERMGRVDGELMERIDAAIAVRPAKHTVGLTPPARTERVRAGEKMRNTA